MKNQAKKSFLKTAAAAAVALTLSGPALADVSITPMKGVQTMRLTQEWDKIFPRSNKVEHHKVTFRNRYGIILVGDLYVPKNIRSGQKLPAIAVAGAFGAVKEQSSGLYAQAMAERGFVTLAFDPSYLGESGGEPRNMASPDINTEDFSAAVDFLGLQNFVNREQIGILGICGWGGMALNAAVGDTRIKAVATSTMYDMTRVMANGYEINMKQNAQGGYDRAQPQMDAEARYQAKQGMNTQRWADAESGTPSHGSPRQPPAFARQIDRRHPAVCTRIFGLLQNPTRLPPTLRQFQRRMVANHPAGVHQHADSATRRRVESPRLNRSRRKSTLTLFQRRRIQISGQPKQRAVHRAGCETHGFV